MMLGYGNSIIPAFIDGFDQTFKMLKIKVSKFFRGRNYESTNILDNLGLVSILNLRQVDLNMLSEKRETSGISWFSSSKFRQRSLLFWVGPSRSLYMKLPLVSKRVG
ncbi:hypothetical protein ACMFMF_011815 [Clarireedia jacksonii]